MKYKTIYELTTKDIYTVAEEALERKPTQAEIKFVEEKIGDYIGWYDIIERLLMESETKTEEKETKMK